MATFRRLLLLALLALLGTGADEPATPQSGPDLNRTAYAALCRQENFPLGAVCRLDADLERGPALDAAYVEHRVLSPSLVNHLSEHCPTGRTCPELWDQTAVDMIKINWHLPQLRGPACRLGPCLKGMLESRPSLRCGHRARAFSFRAFRLMCELVERVEPDEDVMDCVDSVLELLQYNAADLRRNQSDVEHVCNTSAGWNIACQQMVNKYYCLSQRCSIDTEKYLSKFPAWSWYFQNEDELKKTYNLRSCGEEIIMRDKAPLVVAVINMYGIRQAVIAGSIGIAVACFTLLLGFVLYRRYHRRHLTRNRHEYTEMKDEV